MSKILKNNTASPVDVTDAGVTVPSSGQYTLNPTEYQTFAESSDVIVLISDSTLTVNDGSFDLGISEGVDLIKGLFPKEIKLLGSGGGNPSVTNGKLDVNASVTVQSNSKCPTLSNNSVIDSNSTSISFGTSFTSIYSYNGSGKLANFLMRFNTDDCNVKLIVDSKQIFDINLDTYKKILDSGNHGGSHSWLSVDYGEKSLSFNPNCPIEYYTSVLIEVKSDKNTKKVYEYVVCLTKES